MKASFGILLTALLSWLVLHACMSQEQQEQVLQNSEPQAVDVTVNVGGDSRAERFLGTFDQISRLSLDIDRNYGNKRVLTDFPLVNDGSKWTGTINKLIVGFDYKITGHAYKCTDCPEEPEIFVSRISQNESFNQPFGITVDSSGNVYIAEIKGQIIRKIANGNNTTILAGTSGQSGSEDGLGTSAKFNSPSGVASDSLGNIYVADSDNHLIRKIGPSGNVETIAGTIGESGTTDGLGTSAKFNMPSGVAIDSSQNIYVADRYNNLIRKIDSSRNVTTVAGRIGETGSKNGPGDTATFSGPIGISIDSSDNVYVADYWNNMIRKIDKSGNVTTFAGSGTAGSNDGQGESASFNLPTGVSVDILGNVYIADYGNHLIRKIDPNGNVKTLAGISGESGSENGKNNLAKFNSPAGVSVDSSGNVYVADQYNSH
ncbi:MAG: NHL repeat-containing protein, partial [SAR324 cluster bacterium]|nr:NHL repeat-containing protein [SAR324 cluster bacterium]